VSKTSILGFCIVIWLVLLGIWVWQGFSYPHTIYEYHQTGEVREYLDRASGLVVEAKPVWEPDNPPWVGLIRRWAPVTLFAGLIGILALVADIRGWYRSNRH
jgi:hypothetical protein